MTPGSILAALGVALMLLLLLVEARRRRTTPIWPDEPIGEGRPVGDVDRAWPGGGDHAQRDAPLATVFSAKELLAVDHLRGMDAVEQLVARLSAVIAAAERSQQRRPHQPTSILLHGPPSGAMNVVAHELARSLHSRLVHLRATKALPNPNGSAQPRIAAAVNQARDVPPSVLLLDELERVASPSVRDPERMRTASDVLAAALRPMYGGRLVVVGVYATSDDAPVPRRVADAFDHVQPVELRQLERALGAYARRTADRTLLHAIGGDQPADRRDEPSSWHSAA